MKVDAAVRFISAHGDPLEQARLRFIMSGEPAKAETVGMLLASQREDGGWAPFWAAYYSSLDATCFRLAQARQLGIGRELPEIEHALQFMEERQNSRGSWEEDASVAASAPAWVAPGDPAAELYLTANCGYWLALLKGGAKSLQLASAFLRRSLEPAGRMPTFLHAHWLAAGLWLLTGKPKRAEVVMEYLSSRLAEMTSSSRAWMVSALCDAGVTAAHPLIQQAAELLTRQQEPDGRWQSEDGPMRDVQRTLEALLALKMAGQMKSGQ